MTIMRAMTQIILAWGPTVCLVLIIVTHIVDRICRRRHYRSMTRLLRARSRAFDAAAKQNDAATNKAFLLGKADAYSRASMLVSNQLLECPDPGQDIPMILTLDDERCIVRRSCAHIDGADGVNVVCPCKTCCLRKDES